MNKTTYKAAIVLTLILGIGLSSCTKDYFDVENIANGEWNPNLAAPLVNSSLSLDDLIAEYNSDLIQVDETNFVSLYYKNQIYTMEVGELLEIPNQVIPKQLSLNAGEITELSTNGSVQADRSDDLEFDTGEEMQIDSIVVKTGTVTANVSSAYKHSGTLTITLPDVRKFGTPYRMVIPLNYSGSSPVTVEQMGSLAGYTMDLYNPNGGNEMTVDYRLDLYDSGNSTLPTEDITILISLGDLNFSALFGYIGQFDLAIPADTIDIGLFNNSVAGNITLEDPRFKLIVNNSFGMPVAADVVRFDAVSNSGTVGFTGPSIPGQLNLNSPTLNQIGESAKTEIYLDKNNSNIAQVLNSKPNQIIYEMSGLGNPNGPTSGNFATDSSKIEVEIEMELPLHGSVSNLVIQDTLDFSFNQDITQIEEAMFRVYAENGFPIDAELQLYFTDAYDNVLDSMTTSAPLLINSGMVGSNGKVSQASSQTVDILFDSNRISNIMQVEKVIIRGEMSTAQQGSVPVKIYSDYFLNVRVGAQTKLRVGL